MSRLTSSILTRLSLVPRYFSAVQTNSKYFSTSGTLNNSRPVSYNLDNKVAMVTASTDGIGLAIAKRLAQSGASVVISSRKQSNVDKAVADLKGEGLNVEGLVCHVGKDSDRKALVQFTLEKFGGIDIFVSNAAVNPAVGPILDTKEGAWDKIFEINVKAALLLTQDVVPHMEKRKGGSITYISSIGGYQILPDISAYSVSKTALLGLTKAVAIQVAPLNIRANVVCPGIIKTRFSEAIRSDENFLDSGFGRDLLIKRVGEPDEIAGVVAFLSSEDASYITGESVVPAGGYYSRL